MKYLFLIFININKIAAQNLVLNPSFEVLDSCPTMQGQIYNAANWCGISADLFSYCAPYQTVSYPTIHPRTGSNYVGCVVMGIFAGDSTTYARELMFAHLSSTMVNNKNYCVTFYTRPFPEYNCTNGIGAYLTPQPFINDCYNFNLGTLNPTFSAPSISSNIVVDDTSQWAKISGIYTSNGTENYISIGCLQPNNVPTFVPPYVYGSADVVSYYYFDDISIVEVLNKIEAGADTVSCINDSVQIGLPPIDGVEYHWQPHTGLSNPYMSNPKTKLSSNTIYVLTTTQCNVVLHDTLTVTVLQNPCTVSVKEITATIKGLLLLPNPSKGNVIVSGNFNAQMTLVVTNTLGETVLNKTLNNNSESLSLNLTKGIYFYYFITNNTKTETKKIIIE